MGSRNVRTARYHELLAGLPERIRLAAERAFAQFVADPTHPSLRLHKLANDGTGRHHGDSYSVTVTMQYRAVCYVDGDTNVWYWVGSHADYDTLVGG